MARKRLRRKKGVVTVERTFRPALVDMRYVSYCPIEAPEQVAEIAANMAQYIRADFTLQQVALATASQNMPEEE